MKKKIIMYMSVVLLIIGTVLIKNYQEKQGFCKLYFNEAVTANGAFPDEDGEYSDWIEIGYEGTGNIDLTGYYLSDSREESFRWKFPKTELESGEYLIVFASGKDKVTESGELHTNFKLDAMGETIYLSNPEGKKVAELAIPELAFDQSYGLAEEGYVVFGQGSPKEKNLQMRAEKTKETKSVEYSVQAGVYPESICLELSTDEKEAEIFYTLDGSVPGEKSYVEIVKKAFDKMLDSPYRFENDVAKVFAMRLRFSPEIMYDYEETVKGNTQCQK